MKLTEYAEANSNFRFSIEAEMDFYKFHVQLLAILIGAYWLVSDVTLLRWIVCFMGCFVSAIGYVAEARGITYFKHFFDQAARLEAGTEAEQMTAFRRDMKRPLLGIRAGNMILTLFVMSLLFWLVLVVADFLHARWFAEMLVQMHNARGN